MENEKETSAPIELIEKPLSYQGKIINSVMTRKGFWEHTRNIPHKMAALGGFSSEEVEAVRKAFRAQKLALIASELSEALEGDRRNNFADVEGFKSAMQTEPHAYAKNFEMYIKDSFETEIAGTVIRILDFIGGEGIDLDYFVKTEMKYNETREKLHGKAF